MRKLLWGIAILAALLIAACQTEPAGPAFDVNKVPGDWVLQQVENIVTGTITPQEVNQGVIYQLRSDSTGNIHTERGEQGPRDVACRWIWSDTVLYVSEPDRTNVFILEQLDDTALVVRVNVEDGYRLYFRNSN